MESNFWELIMSTGLSGIEYLIPLIVAFLTTWIFRGIKKYAKWLDGLAAMPQQFLVLVTAGLLTWAGNLVGVILSSDIALIAQPEVSAALSAAFAMVIHEARKRLEKENPPTLG